MGQLKKLTFLRVPPAPPTPARRATAHRRRRYLAGNEFAGTFPLALCDVAVCVANSGNDLVAPCGTSGCCDLDDGETCSSSGGGEPTTTTTKSTTTSPTQPTTTTTKSTTTSPTPADSESDPAAAADLAALAAALAGVVMLA